MVIFVFQDELNEEMDKQKIRFDREVAEKNEAFERIRELDGKVNSAATLVRFIFATDYVNRSCSVGVKEVRKSDIFFYVFRLRLIKK